MTTDRDRILSEFIDAWNAGQRPDVDDYISLAPKKERAELAEQLVSFLSVAPTPTYTDADLAAIRADPILVEAMAASQAPGGVLAALLKGARTRLSLTTSQTAVQLVRTLGLSSDSEAKTTSYLQRLEEGDLEPKRVSRRIFEALAKVLGIPRDQLEGAADVGGWAYGRSALLASAPVFRADEDAAASVSHHLEVLADALATPGGEHDEVDELFLGGR